MKRWIMVLLVSLLLANPAWADLSAWLLADNEVIGGRLGYVAGNVEVGGLSYWRYDSEEPPQVFGAYGIVHFQNLIDVNNPLPLPFLPETLRGSPYLGMQIGVNTEPEKRDFIGPIAGVVLQDILVLEYQYRNYSDTLAGLRDDEHVLMAGFRFQF